MINSKFFENQLSDLKRNKIEGIDFENERKVNECENSVVFNIKCPKYSVYSDEMLKLKMTFSEYNFPRIVFLPPIIPRFKGISDDGLIDNSLLNIEYSSKIDVIRKILLGVLGIMRMVKINYLHWKPSGPIIVVDLSYDVPNGLIGMMRNVVLRICSLITTHREDLELNEQNTHIRTLLGVCRETAAWRTHKILGRVRAAIRLEISIFHNTDNPHKIILKAAQTISSLKLKANTSEALYYDGELLKDSRTCYSYNFSKSTILSTQPLLIYVHDLRDCIFPFTVADGDTVWRLKELYQDREGHPANTIRLVFKGKELVNEWTFKDIPIRNGATIRRVFKLR